MKIQFKQPTPEKRTPNAGEIWRATSASNVFYIVTEGDKIHDLLTGAAWHRLASEYAEHEAIEFYAEGLEITE